MMKQKSHLNGRYKGAGIDLLEDDFIPQKEHEEITHKWDKAFHLTDQDGNVSDVQNEFAYEDFEKKRKRKKKRKILSPEVSEISKYPDKNFNHLLEQNPKPRIFSIKDINNDASAKDESVFRQASSAS